MYFSFLQMLNKAGPDVHWTIQPMYQISKTLSIWPYKYSENYKIIPLTLRDKLIACILGTITLIYFCWSIYGKVVYVYHNQLTVTTVTDILFGIPLFVITFTSLYLSNTSHRYTLASTFYEQLNSVAKFDLQISDVTYTKLQKMFLERAVTFLIINILSQITDFALLLQMVEFSEAIFYVGNYIIHNFMVVTFFQIKFPAKILQECFEQLNRKLINFHYSTTKLGLNQTGTDESFFDEKAIYVRKLCFTYKKLCDLIEMINSLYGFRILILMCCIISMILNAFFYCLITGLRERYPNNHNSGLEAAICCNQILVACMHFVSNILK